MSRDERYPRPGNFGLEPVFDLKTVLEGAIPGTTVQDCYDYNTALEQQIHDLMRELTSLAAHVDLLARQLQLPVSATKRTIWCRELETNLSTRCATAGIFVRVSFTCS